MGRGRSPFPGWVSPSATPAEGDTFLMPVDLLALMYRHAVVSGDRSLMKRLARLLRSNSALAQQADALLAQLPRKPATRTHRDRGALERLLEQAVREYDREE